MKTITNIAKVLSAVFSPLIVPFYCFVVTFIVSPLNILPLKSKLITLLILFFMTFALPCFSIWLLYVMHMVKSPGINGRKERLIPYLLGVFWFSLTFYFLWRAHAPYWLLLFDLSGIIVVVINLLVNLKWKISGHMASMGCATALILYLYVTGLNPYLPEIWLYSVIFLSGLVGSARGVLKRHTLGQIGAGYANGLIVTCLIMFLL